VIWKALVKSFDSFLRFLDCPKVQSGMSFFMIWESGRNCPVPILPNDRIDTVLSNELGFKAAGI
jgi:hypothetical protein